MCNLVNEEEVSVHMSDFGYVQRSEYFWGESVGRTQVELKVGKYRHGKDEVIGEIIKSRGELVIRSGSCVIWPLRVV